MPCVIHLLRADPLLRRIGCLSTFMSFLSWPMNGRHTRYDIVSQKGERSPGIAAPRSTESVAPDLFRPDRNEGANVRRQRMLLRLPFIVRHLPGRVCTLFSTICCDCVIIIGQGGHAHACCRWAWYLTSLRPSSQAVSFRFLAEFPVCVFLFQFPNKTKNKKRAIPRSAADEGDGGSFLINGHGRWPLA